MTKILLLFISCFAFYASNHEYFGNNNHKNFDIKNPLKENQLEGNNLINLTEIKEGFYNLKDGKKHDNITIKGQIKDITGIYCNQSQDIYLFIQRMVNDDNSEFNKTNCYFKQYIKRNWEINELNSDYMLMCMNIKNKDIKGNDNIEPWLVIYNKNKKNYCCFGQIPWNQTNCAMIIEKHKDL